MKKINLNCEIWVKLTDVGKEKWISNEDWKDKLPASFDKLTLDGINEMSNDYGYHKFQMWDFVSKFGEHIQMGFGAIIEDNNIYFEENDIKESGDTKWERNIKLTELID